MELPKTLKRYANVIESIHKEDDGCWDKPAYWIYLKKGYICTDMECGTIHEPTVAKCIMKLQSVEKI